MPPSCCRPSGGGSNYPVGAVVTAFGAAAAGTLTAGNATVTYGARATLLGLRRVTDSMSGNTETLQKWEITGWGSRGGIGSSEVEVTAIIDRHVIPLFRYAAFATSTGCGALSFAGGATTNSYNSQALNAGNPVVVNTDGDVGTNGNLQVQGNPTIINGTLSTPRTGVGSCTTSNVTALTVTGRATVSEGLVELPQVVEYETPPPPSPMPPTTSVGMNSSFTCGIYLGCATSGSTVTLTADPTNTVPYSSMGNVTVGPKDLVLNAGTYIFNTLSVVGTAKITTNGKVTIKIAGQGSTSPLSLTGQFDHQQQLRPVEPADHLRRDRQHRVDRRDRHGGDRLRSQREPHAVRQRRRLRLDDCRPHERPRRGQYLLRHEPRGEGRDVWPARPEQLHLANLLIGDVRVARRIRFSYPNLWKLPCQGCGRPDALPEMQRG